MEVYRRYNNVAFSNKDPDWKLDLITTNRDTAFKEINDPREYVRYFVETWVDEKLIRKDEWDRENDRWITVYDIYPKYLRVGMKDNTLRFFDDKTEAFATEGSIHEVVYVYRGENIQSVWVWTDLFGEWKKTWDRGEDS